jgi:metallophosphoesterase (TIGR00282 family)
MRILFCGDVVGRAGRDILVEKLPGLRESLALDLVVVNGENAAGGFGITPDICEALYQVGTDVITLGNHAWDQKGTDAYIETDPRLVRARNFPKGTPGSGGALYTLQDGRKVFVFQLLTQLFMAPIDDPFACLVETLATYRLGHSVDAIVFDIHGEATSEKQALAYLADGKVSFSVGSHTHVPTADARILPGGSGYMTDAGMCGDYDSIIGLEIENSLARFVKKRSAGRFVAASGEATLSGLFVETDDATGLAKEVQPVRVGGILDENLPA